MQKILVITYYWPPAGGPGVQRWLKFVKYLPEFGIRPVVYVPKNPTYPLLDEALQDEVPAEAEILKRSIWEPYGWAAVLSRQKTQTISSGIIREKDPSRLERLLLWLRGNLFVPDARKFWIRPSVRYLSKYIAREGIGTVISSGPPHSLHLIGLGLKKKHDLQWIADFRDPWTTIGYHEKLRLGPWARKRHLRLEREVLQGADKIVVTSHTTREEFLALTDRPIKVITNGYDGEAVARPLDPEFTISHIGSLLSGRNPVGLWKALGELLAENRDFGENLKIQLAGVVGEEVIQSLAQYKLEPYVARLGYIPHELVLGLQRRSQVLLLLEIDSPRTRGIIPGKLFEYMRAGRPILALGPEDWEAGAMVGETGCGAYLRQGDSAGIKAVLLEWYKAFQGEGLGTRTKDLEQYHRRALTESLVKFI